MGPPGPQGPPGPSGGGVISWRWDTSTSGAVGSGKLGIDASTWAAATQIRISEFTDDGTDASAGLDLIVAGETISIQQQNDATRWAKYDITGPTVDHGTYRTMPVTYHDSGAQPSSNNVPLLVQFGVATSGGGGGGGTYVYGETPSGALDGSNTTYTAANVFQANSLEVYLNGLRQRRVADYNEISTTQFQFLSPPRSTDSISIDYAMVLTGAEIYGETPSGALNGTNTTFTTAYVYQPNFLAVFLCGMRLRKPDDYTETSSTTFQLTSAPLSTDSICVDYIKP